MASLNSNAVFLYGLVFAILVIVGIFILLALMAVGFVQGVGVGSTKTQILTLQSY